MSRSRIQIWGACFPFYCLLPFFAFLARTSRITSYVWLPFCVALGGIYMEMGPPFARRHRHRADPGARVCDTHRSLTASPVLHLPYLSLR